MCIYSKSVWDIVKWETNCVYILCYFCRFFAPTLPRVNPTRRPNPVTFIALTQTNGVERQTNRIAPYKKSTEVNFVHCGS